MKEFAHSATDSTITFCDSDPQLIVQAKMFNSSFLKGQNVKKMFNIFWFRPLECKDLLLFFVMYEN